MRSYRVQATVSAEGDLTARVPTDVPAGEASVIVLVPERGSLLLDALDALPSDPESHAHWREDAERIAREREEWA